MKKILLSLFLLCLPFELLNLLYKNAEYSFGDNDVSRFKNVPHNIQVANSGNSLGEQMNYENHPGLTSVKFSLLMQPINCDFQILEQYIDHFSRDSVFYIVLSYGEVDGILSEDIYKMIKGRYYQFLKSKYIEDYSIWDKIRYCAIPIVYAEYPFHKIKQKFFNSAAQENTEEPEEILEAERGKKCFLQKRLEQDNFMNVFNRTYPRQKQSGLDYNKNYVISMAKLCSEHYVHPVVVTPPLPANTVRALEKTDYFEAFEKLKESILEECKNQNIEIDWLDYNRSEEYMNHEEWFKDPVHLKDEYCAKYTDDIIKSTNARGRYVF